MYLEYNRLSNTSDVSIQNQHENIVQYAEENNLTLTERYNEGERQSGFDDTRPEYQKLKERIRNDESISGVITNDKRRLSRDIDEVMRLVPLMRSNGVEWHIAREGKLDLSDPMTAAVEVLQAASAFEEKKAEIEKAREHTEKRIEEGYWQGRGPYGLQHDTSADPPGLVPDEEFEDALRVIARKENAQTHREAIDGLDIDHASKVTQILSNKETYRRVCENMNPEWTKHINDTREVPLIDGRRITLLDVYSVIESDTEGENFEYWGLTDEEIEAVTEYYENNKEKLRSLLDEKTA